MNRFLISCLLIIHFFSIVKAEKPISEIPTLGEALNEKGVFRELDNGDFVNLRIKDNSFYVYFTDADKIVIENPADSVIVKIEDGKAKQENWYGLLKPIDSISLKSTRKIYPPYNLKLNIIIRYQGDEVDSFHNVIFVQTQDE